MSATLATDTTEDLAQLNSMLERDEQELAAAKPAPDPSLNDDGQQAAQPADADAATKAATDSGTTPPKTESKPDEKKEAAPADPAKTETATQGSKYAKEVERMDRSWKAINERKEALEKREAELAKREQEVQQRTAKAEAPRFTAEQYEDFATKAEAEGKYDLAEAAREKAKELRENPQANATARSQQESAALKQSLDASWSKVKAEMPDALDKSKPFNGALLTFLKNEPEVLQHPNGPYLAAMFVRNQMAAGERDQLKSEVETLRAKVKQLEDRTTVPGGGLSRVPQPKAFNEMSLAEQEAELARQYREETGG